MKQSQLLPCPFCGEAATLMEGCSGHWVECGNGHQGATAHSSETAIESWNQRPKPAKEESQEMNITKATEVLADFNKWRRCDAEIKRCPNAKDIGEAIDACVAALIKSPKKETKK